MVEINNKKKVEGNPNIWKPKSIILNKYWIKKGNNNRYKLIILNE